LAAGLALNTINQRLSSIRSFARIAMQSGTMKPQQYEKIIGVRGLRKECTVQMSNADVKALRKLPNTSQGRRDRLLLNLLLEHGLHVSDIAGILVEHIDLALSEMYLPPKGNRHARRIRLSSITMQSLKNYMHSEDFRPHGYLLQSSQRNTTLAEGRMSPRAIHARVRVLGATAGMEKLTPETLQKYWAHSRIDQ